MRHAARKTFLDALVGIETGVLGGLVMLLWFALSSPLIGEPWWLIPNLFASYSYHRATLIVGPGLVTITGAALHLLLSGLIGMLNGLSTPGGRLFGLAMAAAWYLLCYLFLWKRVAPLVPVHASQPIVIVGFWLFGSVLGRHHHFLDKARSTV